MIHHRLRKLHKLRTLQISRVKFMLHIYTSHALLYYIFNDF